MNETVHLIESQGFRCTSCGLCCTRHWGVGVERAVEPGIRASQFHARREREGYVPLRVSEGALTLAEKKEDGSCVFLIEDNLCGLHSELGGEGKPIGCQLYPYRPVRTPSGVFVSQSFACPPVVAGLDRNAEENRAEIAGVLEMFPQGAADLDDGTTPVRLSQQTQISWNSYLQLEQRLRQAYEPERPLESLLGMANSVILCERLAAGSPIEQWPSFPPPPADISFEKALIGSYLVAVISMIERDDDLSARFGVQELLAAGEELPSRLTGALLPAVERGFEGPSGGRFQETFARYFDNCLHGKLFLAPTVVAKLLAVALGHVLLTLYFEGFRRKLGSGEDDLQALTLAYEVMEADALSHSDTLDKFFLDFEETLSKVINAEFEA